jgi:hydroxymethylglutaryl-CoA reductase (NADPH)
MANNSQFTAVPTRLVNDIFIRNLSFNFKDSKHSIVEHDVLFQNAPLSTYETALFYSVNRGAKISRLCGGFDVNLISDLMTRSCILEVTNTYDAVLLSRYIEDNIALFQEQIISKVSRFAILEAVKCIIISNLVYVRFSFQTGNASGHNMATICADRICDHLISSLVNVRYISVSGNFCTDKKVSCVNSILGGRGKNVIAECLISREICAKFLKTTPEKMVDLNMKKNLIGSIISGSIASANAHFANMLLAFYIATGQDGANVVEGSQGVTFLEIRGDDLYFSVNLPNIIVGVVGNGKSNNDFVLNRFQRMNIAIDDVNASKRLACIAASLVLCGEMSLMAALTNQNELSNSHVKIERFKRSEL